MASETTGNFSFVAPRLEVMWAAALRFPLASLAALAFAVLQSLNIHGISSLAQSGVWPFAAFCSFFALLAAGLACEARGWGKKACLAVSLAVLGLLALWLYVAGSALGLPHWMLAAALVLICVVSPSLGGASNEEYWYFNQQTFLGFGIAGLATMLFALGISLIGYAVSELFGLSAEKWILTGLTVIAAMFWPVYTITFIPKLPCRLECAPNMPAALAFVLCYIALPVLLIYGAVIAVYGVQVMGLGRGPATSVSWMVMGFSAAAIALHALLYPLRLQGNVLVRFFERRIFVMLLPLLGLLFWALALRIQDYGITENRYLAMLGGFWAAMIAVFVVIRQGDVRLANAPAALATLLLLTSLGPWGAESIAYQVQQRRLADLLQAAGVLEQGQISEPATAPDVEWKLRAGISDLLDYFHDRRDGRLPPYLQRYANVDASMGGGWAFVVMQRWQMRYISSWERSRDRTDSARAVSFAADNNFMQSRTPLSVAGYDLLVPFQQYANGTVMQHSLSDLGLTLRLQPQQFDVSYADANRSFTLQELFGPLLEAGSSYLTAPALVQEFELAGARFRMIINSANLEQAPDGNWALQMVDGFVMVKPADKKP